ncbi:MAG: GAF domain-containing SpoIIE family protein phosphatase [Candidatus Acidiferrales bacterium]
MNASSASGKENASSLERLDAALRSIQTEAAPAELAAQIAALVAGEDGIKGARIWRDVSEQAAVSAEHGQLPAADAARLRALREQPAGEIVNGSYAAWVLGKDGECRGALEVFGAAALDEEKLEWLRLVRRYADVVLVSSERRSAVSGLSIVLEATQRLNSTLDLAELIDIILHLATRYTGADRGTVFLLDRERDEIWSLVGLGLEKEEIRLPASRGIAGWVAHHGEVVNLADAYQDPRFEPEVDRRLNYRTRTLLCLPIRNKNGQTSGVLQLLNKKGGPFQDADVSLLSSLSVHVALALENAQLHRDVLAKQRMERDLALARSIQLGLLPERSPQIVGFELEASHQTSLEVGGDYYDFIPLGPQTMLNVVADVEGKGVGSAMVMANLQATLHALIAHVHSLERLVSALNERMLADTRGQKYMTMYLSILDQRNKTLHYVNAGHVPPILLRADGSVEYLREGGMVVGLFPNVPFERGNVKLNSGDILAGYTDGITEASNPEDEEFGYDRLVELLKKHRNASAREIVDLTLAEVERFSRGGTHEDDRVMLVMKIL